MSHLLPSPTKVNKSKTALLSAATRLFAEYGVNAPIEPLAEMAKVSRATLYRHFPDRKSILLALFDQTIDELLLEDARSNPASDLYLKITKFASLAKRSPVMADAWREIPKNDPDLTERHRRITAHFEQPLQDALRAGTVRADLTLHDVITVIRMVAAGSRYPEDISYERIIDLAFNGLRSQP